MANFEGQILLVTGAATGLGAALALGAAKSGAQAVLLNYSRSVKEVEEAADAVRTAGAEAVTICADVSQDSDCRKLAEAAARYGRLDGLANNAGVTKHVPDHADLDGLDAADFQRIFAVNVIGAFQATRALRALLEAAERPAVLMVSSLAAVTGIGTSLAYAASKGALNTMTLSLARALAPKIRVNALCPGFIHTRWHAQLVGAKAAEQMRIGAEQVTPLKLASMPEDIAEAGLFLLSPAARHMTGETLIVDAGMHLGFAATKAR